MPDSRDHGGLLQSNGYDGDAELRERIDVTANEMQWILDQSPYSMPASMAIEQHGERVVITTSCLANECAIFECIRAVDDHGNHP